MVCSEIIKLDFMNESPKLIICQVKTDRIIFKDTGLTIRKIKLKLALVILSHIFSDLFNENISKFLHSGIEKIGNTNQT